MAITVKVCQELLLSLYEVGWRKFEYPARLGLPF